MPLRCLKQAALAAGLFVLAPSSSLLEAFLVKFVAGLEFTSIDPGLIVVSSGVAISPTEKKIRTQWENNSSAVDLGFNAHAFGRRWECKVQRLPENHRIGLADNVAFHGMKHLRFQQKSGGHGPAIHDALALRNSFPVPASREAEPIAAFHFPSGEHGGCPWQGTFALFITWKVFTALPMFTAVVVFMEYLTMTFPITISGLSDADGVLRSTGTRWTT